MSDSESWDTLGERVFAGLSPPERARVAFEAKLDGVSPVEWVDAAIDEYDATVSDFGEAYDPERAVHARVATIDMEETLRVEVEVGIDPPLFKRAWLRYETARWNGTADARTFDSIMFDYVDFNPTYEVMGPLHDLEDLLVPCEDREDSADAGDEADDLSEEEDDER